jgi:hypothetical protein
MLGYLAMSTETQLYREYSRDSSVPLVARPFLAESFVPVIFEARISTTLPSVRSSKVELALAVIKFCRLTEPKGDNL